MQYQRGSIGLFFRGDPSLKLWSPFDDNAADFSNYSHNGTIIGSVPFIPAKFNKGAFFSGNTANYIDYGNPTDFNFGTGPFTLMLWVKFNSIGTFQFILDKHNSNTNPYTGYEIILSSLNVFRFDVSDTSTLYTLSGNIPIVANKWYLVAATREGTTAKLYVNGILDVSGTCPGGSTDYATNLVCGKASNYNGYPVNGIIDEVAIFSRALSSQEIAQYYKWATSPRPKLLYYDPIITSYSTSALLSQLEKVLQSTTSLASLLEEKNVDLVALLTELQYQGYSTTAIQTLLEGIQRGDVALISELQRAFQDTLALKSTLRAKIWRREHYTPSQNWIKENLH